MALFRKGSPNEPIGTTKVWHKPGPPPTGWLFMHGGSFQRAIFPELFEFLTRTFTGSTIGGQFGVDSINPTGIDTWGIERAVLDAPGIFPQGTIIEVVNSNSIETDQGAVDEVANGLFRVMPYGALGADVFSIPDWRGRVPAARDMGVGRLAFVGVRANAAIHGNSLGQGGGIQQATVEFDEVPQLEQAGTLDDTGGATFATGNYNASLEALGRMQPTVITNWIIRAT